MNKPTRRTILATFYMSLAAYLFAYRACVVFHLDVAAAKTMALLQMAGPLAIFFDEHATTRDKIFLVIIAGACLVMVTRYFGKQTILRLAWFTLGFLLWLAIGFLIVNAHLT